MVGIPMEEIKSVYDYARLYELGANSICSKCANCLVAEDSNSYYLMCKENLWIKASSTKDVQDLRECLYFKKR